MLNLNQALAVLCRHRTVAICAASAAFFMTGIIYLEVPRRYQAVSLVVMQSVEPDATVEAKRTSLGDIGSLARIADTDAVICQSAINVGVGRLFPDLDSARQKDVSVQMMSLLAIDADAQESSASVKNRPLEQVGKVGDNNPVASSSIIQIESNRSKPQLARILRSLHAALVAKPEDKFGLLSITFTHHDPKIASEMTNELVKNLIARFGVLSSRTSTLRFFEDQLQGYRDATQKAEQSLLEFVTEHQELGSLAAHEQEFNSLRQASISAASAEQYGKQIISEQIRHQLSGSDLSSLRVVQSALEPDGPIFPSRAMFGMLAVVGMIISAVGSALLADGFFLERSRIKTVWIYVTRKLNVSRRSNEHTVTDSIGSYNSV